MQSISSCNVSGFDVSLSSVISHASDIEQPQSDLVMPLGIYLYPEVGALASVG